MTKILIKYHFLKKNLMVKKSFFKYFIGYNDDDDDDDDDDAIRPLYIKFPQIIAEHFDSNETMSFKASDSKVLKT